MKKIIFFVVKNSRDNSNKIFFEENKNSLFWFWDGRFFFDSKYKSQEEIVVQAQYIKFDEILYKKLVIIKSIAIEKSAELSKEEIGYEITKGSLDGLIYSQVEKASYENPRSVFYFCANLFVKILMEHKLNNGNKRLALLFLIATLRNFGYHLNWSRGIRQNYKFYKSKIENFVEKLEKGYNEYELREIEDWIKAHSTIAIQWR